MKESAIRQILCGEKGQYDSIKRTEEQDRLLKILLGLEEELKSKLPPDLLKLYMMTDEALDKYQLEVCDTHFEEGFNLGLRLGLQA